jgi:pimeloyl-ACP methyl ester carboxylesterase
MSEIERDAADARHKRAANLSPNARGYREHLVPRGPHHLYARDYPGEEPPIALLHGFPDNQHLYDRLVPELAGRRVVAFDFLGWGASDKPAGYPYTASNQTDDLDAVISHLQLASVVLVAHDASGPPAIDWALDHQERISALVLLNTYYCRMSQQLRPPEAIWLFSTPIVRWFARPASMWFGGLLFRHMYEWQVGRFFRDAELRARFVPQLYDQFTRNPSAHEAFFGLNRDLPSTLTSRLSEIPRLRRFTRPVRIVFGAADPYLNRRVARRLHELLPTSELFLLPGARHYVQMDEPQEVARLILALPGQEAAAAEPDRDPGESSKRIERGRPSGA